MHSLVEMFCDVDDFPLKNHGEGDSSQVLFRSQKTLDVPIERLLTSLNFEQLGETGSIGG